MKKRKIKNYLKIGTAILSLLLASISCQHDDEVPLQKLNTYQTVNQKEVSEFLTSNIELLKVGRINNSIGLSFDINKLTYEPINNSNELLAVIPAKTNDSNFFSRIIMIKINNITHSVLFNLIHDKNTTSNLFTGIIFITDLKGNFINAFKVNNGKFISFYKKYSTINKISTNYRITDGYETCPNHEGCIFATQELNEVIITGSSNSFNWLNWFFIGLDQMQDQFGGSSGGGESWDYYMPSATDGENLNACGDGWVYDINTGFCVEDKKSPCENVYNLMNEPKTKAAYDILEGKVKESREYGFGKTLDGIWIELKVSEDGHSVEHGNSQIGFLHTHTYNTRSIHMLSDIDIIKFLFNVRHAASNGIDMSEVIGGMVSASGTYVMTYDGNILSDFAVLGGWTDKKMRDEYLDSFNNSNGNLSQLFHDFINKLGLKGITLTKRQTDGTYKKSVLNTDGTTKEKEC